MLPRKSVAATPISPCTRSHGSRFRGGRGCGGGGARCSAARSTMRRALKYSGLLLRHSACFRCRRSLWHEGDWHTYWRGPTRASGTNHRPQMAHGRFFLDSILRGSQKGRASQLRSTSVRIRGVSSREQRGGQAWLAAKVKTTCCTFRQVDRSSCTWPSSL
jgi:hypothetical protein